MHRKTIDGCLLLEQTGDYIRVSFDRPRCILSCAVFNGGWVRGDAVLNLRVSKHPENSEVPLDPPEKTLLEYCIRLGWKGLTVGMMTAASMNSLRIAEEEAGGVSLVVMVTSGLSNPMRAGDPGGYGPSASLPEIGTINTILCLSASLTPAAMTEAVVIATEAKAAALQSQGIRSPISGGIATGTGTDAIAVACLEGKPQIRYCGKHTFLGESLARGVIRATCDSISGYNP